MYNFWQHRKKRFAGHSVAGYVCQIGFSPDGKWISSGDSTGDVVFWDWKTGRMKVRLKAHSKVVIAHEWLPHETVGSAVVYVYLVLTPMQSKVATAAFEGVFCAFGKGAAPVNGNTRSGLMEMVCLPGIPTYARLAENDYAECCVGLMVELDVSDTFPCLISASRLTSPQVLLLSLLHRPVSAVHLFLRPFSRPFLLPGPLLSLV